MIPNSASTHATNPEHTNTDPSLTALIAGTAMVVALSVYWLYDTYLVRDAVQQTLQNGKTYVTRLNEPRRLLPTIRAGGEQLVQTITRAKILAVTLKQQIAAAAADRATREEKYQGELAAIQEHSKLAERLLAELMTEIEGLPRSALAAADVAPRASASQ